MPPKRTQIECPHLAKHRHVEALVVNYTDVAIGAHVPGSQGALTSLPPAGPKALGGRFVDLESERSRP
jgi:hypothetical protein